MRDGLRPGFGRAEGKRGYTRRVPWLGGLRHRQHDKRVDKAARLAAAIALVIRRTWGRVMGRVILAQVLRRAPRRDKGEIGRIERAGVDVAMRKADSGQCQAKGNDHNQF
jgi:hypothetical protein